jgi:nitroreductase
MEAGAAAQNVLLQATAEGLGCVLIAGIDDEATAKALGLEPPMVPLLHLCFGWPATA